MVKEWHALFCLWLANTHIHMVEFRQEEWDCLRLVKRIRLKQSKAEQGGSFLHHPRIEFFFLQGLLRKQLNYKWYAVTQIKNLNIYFFNCQDLLWIKLALWLLDMYAIFLFFWKYLTNHICQNQMFPPGFFIGSSKNVLYYNLYQHTILHTQYCLHLLIISV